MCSVYIFLFFVLTWDSQLPILLVSFSRFYNIYLFLPSLLSSVPQPIEECFSPTIISLRVTYENSFRSMCLGNFSSLFCWFRVSIFLKHCFCVSFPCQRYFQHLSGVPRFCFSPVLLLICEEIWRKPPSYIIIHINSTLFSLFLPKYPCYYPAYFLEWIVLFKYVIERHFPYTVKTLSLLIIRLYISDMKYTCLKILY